VNGCVITDLMQFITTAVSQVTFDLREDLKRIDTKIDDLSHFVAEAIETINEVTDRQLKNHGKRITKLERKPA
jgi:hypothetical protein